MINPITLRPATLADYDFGFYIKKQALGEYIDKTWGWDENEQLEYYKKEFTTDNTCIIMHKDQRIGWFVLQRAEKEDYLHIIYLFPEYQNQGIGTSIIRDVINQAKADGKSVILNVLKVNQRAKALYERLGFLKYDETETHFLMKVSNDFI